MNRDIVHCAKIIVREKRLVRDADCPEVAEFHKQMIILYRPLLKMLLSRRPEIRRQADL